MTAAAASAPLAAPCAHCGSPALARCAWMVIKPTPLRAHTVLKVGDILSQPLGWRARILDKTPDVPGAFEFSVRILQNGTKPLPEGRNISRFRINSANMFLFAVERPAACDKPCCYRCRRNPDPTVSYCMDHWSEQGRVLE